MDVSNDTTAIALQCQRRDDLGYDLFPMYRILFQLGCITVSLGILLNVMFMCTFVALARRVFDVNSHALFLSCVAQVPLVIYRGPFRLYFYYHSGCLPAAGSPLCQVDMHIKYIFTQINRFLIVQLSFERLLLVVKPMVFHRARHQRCSLALFVHYIGLGAAIGYPCLYYPIIMQNGATTIDSSHPLTRQTCDLWYVRPIYELFDLLITSVPYFLILTSCLSVIGIISYRKYLLGHRQGGQFGTRNHRRLLSSLQLFLFWFLLTWSPWVLYDFIQTVLDLTYSIYIDAITTFIVYLNYTFSSTIVLITFKDMRQFWFAKFRCQRGIFPFRNRIVPAEPAGIVAVHQP